MWKAELSRSGGQREGDGEGEGKCPCQEHTTQRFTKQILLELQKGSRPRSPHPTKPTHPGEKRPRAGAASAAGTRQTLGSWPQHGGPRVPCPSHSEVGAIASRSLSYSPG